MKFISQFFSLVAAISILSVSTTAGAAFDPRPGTDDPESFYNCFYLGNIVDDPQQPGNEYLEANQVTFHDGRAIQLLAMGLLVDGHSKDYILANKSKIADFARANPATSESSAEIDWYDGRVAALLAVLWCDTSGEYPRAGCPAGVTPPYPDGTVLDRLTDYVRPCCVLSGTAADEELVDFFPCQLQ